MKKINANVTRQLASAKFGMFAIALLLLQVSSLSAGVLRGTFMGSTVSYVDVFEDSATDPGLVTPGPLGGLFGVPTVAGDSLDFNPKGFAATSSNGSGADITDGNLQFMVVAKPGNAIGAIAFSERGDTTLAGLGGEAFTSVTNTIFVEINEINGIPVSINLPPANMTFSPSDGTYFLSIDGGGVFYQSDWTGVAVIPIGALLPTGAFATKVSVSLNNTLVAISTANTTAFIQKKDFDGITITTETFDIPEPATMGLIALSLGLLGIRRRR